MTFHSDRTGMVPLADRWTAADDAFHEFVTKPVDHHRRMRLLREVKISARPADVEVERLKRYDAETEGLRDEMRRREIDTRRTA